MQDTLMDHEGRIRLLEQMAAETREALRGLDSRFTSLEGQMNSRFNEVNARFNEVNARITSVLVVTIILWATTIFTIIGAAVGFILGTR